MNPSTRRVALYAIGMIAVLASLDALAHSYAGLYWWAAHHRLAGWQAWSWPAEIDVFLVVGELALYVAYLDGWPARHRLWPWVTAVAGLVVSVAGNVGHVTALPNQPVTVADRLTAAASPLAAFAGLMVGLLIIKLSGLQVTTHAVSSPAVTAAEPRTPLLIDAARLVEDARSQGQTLSRRALAAQLRERGHRFSNETLRDVAGAASSAPLEDLAA